jgi:EmrB/QacA subfamily drug resistance transporter
VLVPIYGKLSDQFGRRRVLLAAIFIFLGGSFLCGVSTSTAQLIAFRAVQGAGSAGLFTTAFAVVADIFAPRERGRYQGIFGGVFGLASVVGPLAGGFITGHWAWYWVFFVNLPIGLIAVLFIVTRMPPLRLASREGGRLDWLGALMVTAGVVPLLLALSFGRGSNDRRPNGWPWLSWQIGAMVAAAVVGTALFVMVERRAPNPIIDLSLFGIRPFRLTALAAFVVGGSFLAAIVFLPLFMVNVVGLSATDSGLTTTPLTFGLIAGNVVVGQLVARIGRYKGLLVGSLVILCVSMAVMGWTLTAHSTQGEVTLKMILVGIGLGPSIPLFTLAIQSAVLPQRIGVATSMATFSRQMGSTVGIAIVGTIFATTLAARIGEERSNVMARTPLEFREKVAAIVKKVTECASGGAEGMESGMGTFDVEKAKECAHQELEKERRELEAAMANAPPDDPRRRTLSWMEAKETKTMVMGKVDDYAQAMKEAFTDAIRTIYQASVLIAVLGLLISLVAPEVPLRGPGGPGGPGGPPRPVAE